METQEQCQVIIDENPTSCPLCDGNDHTVLGILGKRLHLRCRSCGIDFSAIVPIAD